MPERTPVCQLGVSEPRDSRLISPHQSDHNTHTPTLETEHLIDYSGGPGRGGSLLVTAASQWLHATTGRIATDAYSWMQAVHWIAGSGLYTPARTHGPKWGPTTIAIAQEISALKECRPGVDYLARKLKVAERTVQYHLGMLREAGLLVYRSKGTRLTGVGGRASEFERVIPLQFDEALGIRTVGEGATRRPVGAAAESRSVLGKLAKKAARKVRRPRRRTPVSGRGLCTPMQGGTSGASSADRTYSPSESKLASGAGKSVAKKDGKRGPRKLNKVRRRYQLAAELIRTVPWLHGASVPRIAWIIRHVADAGWTALEVQAVAEQMPLSAYGVKRQSGFLAYRIGNAHTLWTTKERRRTAVEAWQDSRRAEQDRHAEFIPTAPIPGPRSAVARQAIEEAFAAIRQRLAPAPTVEEPELDPLTLDDLTREEIVQMRLDAMADPSLILGSLELAGEEYTRRLYTSRLVDQTLTLKRLNARSSQLTPAF